ncbi:MAG: hydrolase [Planctomycetes bacterium]|nr:hydrolase [Planctomycetota bacterium]
MKLAPERRDPGCAERHVEIRCGAVTLEGDLAVPSGARGVVVFAHGSGSSRKSPRNRFVAEVLNQGRLATLLFDLLAAEEEAEGRPAETLRFDIPFLAGRLVGALEWVSRREETRRLPVGCFGASTGVAVALVAAARRPGLVRAVVSRGGRPDLASFHLGNVRAPTLLIVGGDDHAVLRMNLDALALLRCEKRLAIVPRASHLFEEPGTLEEAAALACGWFRSHLIRTPREVFAGRPS